MSKSDELGQKVRLLSSIQAERRLMELDTTNRLLRSQLSETTVSFRNAIETTHKFLLEGQP